MPNKTYLAEIDKALSKMLIKRAEKNYPSKIPFTQELVNSGHFIKIAYDAYKVDNDPYESLWLLQELEGRPHLVRASDPQFSRENKGDWTAVSDYDKQNVTLTYKDVPIARFSSKEFGFSSQDIFTFKSALLEKIGNDQEFVKDLLTSQPIGKKDALVVTFPEFKKFV